MSIRALSSRETVSNFLVFIADSVRFDHLPDAVADRGVTARTVAASSYTASSIPSMMSGTYPSTHRVWNFNDSLAATPSLLRQSDVGFDATGVWTHVPDENQRPPLRILRLAEGTTYDEMSPPSGLVIHHEGGHAPYGDVPHDGSPEFFREYAGRDDELRRLYRGATESAGEQFLEYVEKLEDQGLLDDTLVVFTSDHGELLGEHNRGGVYTHGSPVCPETLDVPTVFVGAGLPEGKRLDGLLSGVDLAPTLLGARGDPADADQLEGQDVWSETPSEDRVVRSEFWANEGRLTYGAGSAWDLDGGVVTPFPSRLERLGFAVDRKLWSGAQAPANRSLDPRQYWSLVTTFCRNRHVYGDPDRERVEAAIRTEFEEGRSYTEVEEIPEEQLRKLGYL